MLTIISRVFFGKVASGLGGIFLGVLVKETHWEHRQVHWPQKYNWNNDENNVTHYTVNQSFCYSRFKSTNVGIVTGYPEDDRNDLRLKIYLDLPSGANATGTLQCVVEKGALQGKTSNFFLIKDSQNNLAVSDNFFLDLSVNSFPNKPWFLCVCCISLLKTLWKKEKLLVTSNFSFSPQCFLPIGKTNCHFYHI